MVGIGVTTYSSLASLKECVSRIERHTAHYTLFVSDDGSTDGTREYVKGTGIGRSYPNRGLAINRNRCLRELFCVRGCRVAVIMDDDATVETDGWEQEWIRGAEEFGHVDYDFQEHSPAVRWARGDGAGHCSATSRECFEKVGYCDVRYSPGWGYEDWDYTRRCRQAMGWPEGTTPVLGGGVRGGGSGRWATEEGLARNRAVYEDSQSSNRE